MDRRTFALALSGLGFGLLGCADSDPVAPVRPGGNDTPPVPPLPPAPSSFDTSAERALGVAAGLVRAAEPAEGGLRWRKIENGAAAYPTELYSGQAGVLAFLAEAYRHAPGDALRRALEGGGRWLERQPLEGSAGLFAGSAGRAWAFLSLHEALGASDPSWLAAALRLAPGIAANLRGSAGDLFTGLPGQGLLLLRLHALTGDPRWLAAARGMADAILPQAVRVGDGHKFAIGVIDGRTTFYVGMAHGTAGVAYFLCRLADALPAGEREPYLGAARRAAAWLDSIARPAADGTNWYRREPDQMATYQAQWCHGAAGIGLLYADLYRVTRDPAYLATATRAAAEVEALGGRVGTASQCHGLAGNADLFLKLFRVTGDARWLGKATLLAELAWARRYPNTDFPGWPSADGHSANNPGLMTGTAGVGWLYLQLATDGRLSGAVTG